jgi:hypothetical protein
MSITSLCGENKTKQNLWGAGGMVCVVEHLLSKYIGFEFKSSPIGYTLPFEPFLQPFFGLLDTGLTR